MLTVPEVLDRFSHPRGSRGRTTCPLHPGDNQQVFSYEESRWYCFAGCGGGGAKSLLDRLAPPTFLGLDRSDGGDLLASLGSGFFKPRRSQRLDAALRDRVGLIQQRADTYHREAIEDWALASDILRSCRTFPALAPEFEAWTFDLLYSAWDRLWRAEQYTGCDCRTPAPEGPQIGSVDVLGALWLED